MNHKPHDPAREEFWDSCLEEAARNATPEPPADLPEKIVARIQQEERKTRLIKALSTAATLTVLLGGPALLAYLGSSPHKTDSVMSDPPDIAEGYQDDTFTVPTLSLTVASLFPETGQALRKNRDSLVDYSRSMQNAAMLFTSKESPKVEQE